MCYVSVLLAESLDEMELESVDRRVKMTHNHQILPLLQYVNSHVTNHMT